MEAPRFRVICYNNGETIRHRPLGGMLRENRFSLLFIILLLISIAAGCGGQASSQATSADRKPPAPWVGHPAPDFTLTDLEGKPWTLSELRGRPVLLNFWATWCLPCRFEMPAIGAVYERFVDQGFVVFAVNVLESRDIAYTFAEEFNLTFPVLLDSTGKVADAYQVHFIPTSFFVDREGVISNKHIGPMTEETIENYLMEILR